MSSELRAPTLEDLPALLTFFDELEKRYGDLNLSRSKLRDDFARRKETVEQNSRILLEDGRVVGWVALWSPCSRIRTSRSAPLPMQSSPPCTSRPPQRRR